MEQLNSDEKMLILMKLTPDEIIKVCQTSKEMYRVCNDDRFTLLWSKKIKEEFDIDYDGERGYDKYRDLRMLYGSTFYNVLVQNVDYAPDSFTVLFDSYKKAEDYIINSLIKQYSYSKIKTALLKVGYVKGGQNIYIIEQKHLNKTKFENLQSLQEDYENKKKKFYSLYEGDEGEIDDALTYIFTDLNSTIEGGNSGARLDKEVNFYVKNFTKEFDMEKYTKEVKEYIMDNILIPDLNI